MQIRVLAISLSVFALGACGGGEGTDTTGGTGGTTPTGGTGGTVSVPTCVAYKTLAEIEQNIILPKCGKDSTCHGPRSAFPPKMDTVEVIRPNTVGKPGVLYCQKDRMIDKTNPARSLMLAKLHAPGDEAVCPSGGPGGLRMPYMPDPPLPKAELDCMTWYVHEVAKLP